MKRMALCAVALIAASTSSLAQKAAFDRNGLSVEMNAMTSSDWRPGVPFGNKLAALPGSTGFEILRDNWKKGASAEARKQMFKGFVFNDHPDTLKVLNLGATDPDFDLQNWSFTYLKEIAFIDFNEEYSRYPAWFAKYGNGKLEDVRKKNFERFISEVAASKGADRELNYRKLSRMTLGRQQMHSTLALAIVKDVFLSVKPSQDGARAAGKLLEVVEPGEGFLRDTILPALHSPSAELRYTAAHALVPCKAQWVDEAFAALLKASLGTPNGMRDNGFMIGMAIGERKDRGSIPLLIGAIAADNTYNSVYGIGYFGLSKLTGVTYDESHDGQWWLKWWSSNKGRFPESVRDTPIPTFVRPPA